MADQTPFLTRVRDIISLCAHDYKDFFVDFDYLLCSRAFKHRPFYIISSDGDNYKHLTGVQSALFPEIFFEKCLNGSLTESDISFIKKGQSEREVKGSVRRKISVLPLITSIFQQDTIVEEDYKKNRIRCSFAAERNEYTLGFTLASPNTKPMTLLKGKSLDQSVACKLDLVLRKRCGNFLYDSIIVGDISILKKYYDQIDHFLSDNLREAISGTEE